MTRKYMPRRGFLTSMLAGIPIVALDWASFPSAIPEASTVAQTLARVPDLHRPPG